MTSDRSSWRKCPRSGLEHQVPHNLTQRYDRCLTQCSCLAEQLTGRNLGNRGMADSRLCQRVFPERNKQCSPQGEIGRPSMKLVEAHVAKKQAEFANHAFFSEQRAGSGLWGALSFAPDLTFWVMAFQDVLRLNAALTRDPQMRKIVRHHRAEDAGHERWFLDDLAAMQMSAPDVRWLFGDRHSPTRDAAYALVSEVYRTTDDRLRLVLVKTLESPWHVF